MAGSLVHFEMPAQDSARARDFYSSLFGWTFESWDGPIEYHMTQAGGTGEPGGAPGGAVYPSQEGERGPIVYFNTEDIDADVARVRELGGQAEDKAPIPGVGWFARCFDPEGNPFSLYQSDESVQPTAHQGP